MKIQVFLFVLLAVFLSSTAYGKDIPLFPFETGAHWVYKGRVQWAEPVSRVKSIIVTWHMKVKSVASWSGYEMALIEGHPGDLPWYDPGRKPNQYILIRDAEGRYYEIRRFEEYNGGWEHLSVDLKQKHEQNAIMFNSFPAFKETLAALSRDNMIWDPPPVVGKQFGKDPDSDRTDGFYCWTVLGHRTYHPKYLLGAGSRISSRRHILIYRTNPDHIIIDYVPGIGIARYQYQHHGTVSTVDVRLVGFCLARNH